MCSNACNNKAERSRGSPASNQCILTSGSGEELPQSSRSSVGMSLTRTLGWGTMFAFTTPRGEIILTGRCRKIFQHVSGEYTSTCRYEQCAEGTRKNPRLWFHVSGEADICPCGLQLKILRNIMRRLCSSAIFNVQLNGSCCILLR